MKADELVDYIFDDRAHLFGAFLRALESSSRFLEFTEIYCDKIRRKIRDAHYDAAVVRDVLAEIEWAYLALQVDRFSEVEYELYGTKKPNPDLTVTDSKLGIVFNIEVKRIRPPDVEKRFEVWKRRVVEQVKAIPSSLAFSIDIGSFNMSGELADRLEAKSDCIVSYIVETIVMVEKEMSIGDEKRYSMPGFEDAFEFRLTKPSGKVNLDHTSYHGGSFPLPVTHKEYRKFGDEICDPEHLGQIRPGMVNILAISTNSSAHDYFDLGKAIDSLKELVEKGDDEFFINKGFEGVEDFTIQLRRLSGILFRGAWFSVDFNPNVLWRNDTAEYPIPNSLAEILQRLDYPRSKRSFKEFISSIEQPL